ncbi:MAG: NAD(P)-binding domain-containing protein [Cytophagales bacterium]|nr:NAD(P)-binding domain-containing protein [Cytophagales bacterium]
MTKKKVIIMGAGPGGVQLAYFLEKMKVDYLVLERNDKAGSFFSKFPIQRRLISINKVYTGSDDPEVNMRFDWNSLLSDKGDVKFKDYSKEYFPDPDHLVNYLNDYVKTHDLNVNYNSCINEIKKTDETFEIVTQDAIYQSEYLVVATGLSKPNIPEIENIDISKNYEDIDNPEIYANRRVLIIGKGNSALETAESLTPYASLIHCLSPSPIKMAWQSHYVGNLRAINNNFLDTYQLKSQNGIINGQIKKIEKQGSKILVEIGYANANGEVETIEYDDIITCAGFRFDNSIFHFDSRPEMTINNKFPLQTSSWESKNVDNLFFAGTLTHMRDYKKSTSGFIHGFRYNSKCLSQILINKLNNSFSWETDGSETLDSTALSRKIIINVNRAASIWQQFGFISHVVCLNIETNSFEYFYDVPVDYLHDNTNLFATHFMVITLEYGNEVFENADNIFAVQRVHKDDVDNADKSAFLHPVIREYRDGALLSSHHIIEDFESNWSEEAVHFNPLQKHINARLEEAGKMIEML